MKNKAARLLLWNMKITFHFFYLFQFFDLKILLCVSFIPRGYILSGFNG